MHHVMGYAALAFGILVPVQEAHHLRVEGAHDPVSAPAEDVPALPGTVAEVNVARRGRWRLGQQGAPEQPALLDHHPADPNGSAAGRRKRQTA
jgi:hypothetical protein